MTTRTDTAGAHDELLGRLEHASRSLDGGLEPPEVQRERDSAIVELSKFGVPRSVVAKLTGLTRGRVQQLLERAGADGPTGTVWREDPEFRARVEAAIFRRPIPSVGVGLRRESVLGPHVGHGWGGRLLLGED